MAKLPLSFIAATHVVVVSLVGLGLEDLEMVLELVHQSNQTGALLALGFLA